LKPALTVNVTPEGRVSKAKIEEMKVALRELGTPENIEVSDELAVAWGCDVSTPWPLHWESVYRHDASLLCVHGRRTTSTHQFRRYI
jgi:hypothetical protein